MATVTVPGRVRGRELSTWKKFLGAQWSPPEVEVQFPDRCPHCFEAASREIAIWGQEKVGGNDVGRVKWLVPVCDDVREPIWSYLLGIVFGFAAIVAGLAAMVTGALAASVLVLVFGFAAWRSWADRSWIRCVGFDQHAFKFRVHRSDYARAFAELNGTKVGSPRLPRAFARHRTTRSGDE